MKTKNETFNPYAEENEFAVRPEWGDWFFYRKPNRKEEIRFRRAKAAYDLAALVAKNSFDGEPTPTKVEVEEAYTLLNSIIRYALLWLTCTIGSMKILLSAIAIASSAKKMKSAWMNAANG